MDWASLESCHVFMEQIWDAEELLLLVVPKLGILVTKAEVMMPHLRQIYA